MKLARLAGLCLLIAVMASVIYHAVDLSSMEVTKTYSDNKKYCLEIVPKGCEGNDSACLGRFYTMDTLFNYNLKWTRYLLNTALPSRAIVSNDGKYVVTMNEWTTGDNSDKILVVYGPEGELIRNFTLNEIAGKDEIDSMRSSNNRRWWRDKTYFINDNNILKIISINEISDEVIANGIMITLQNGDIQSIEKSMSQTELSLNPDAFFVVDVPAKPVKQGYPHYPAEARRLEQEGSVYVKMLVDLDGTIMKAIVIKSSGYPLLDSEAVNTTYQWEFTPAQFQGKPVRVWVSTPMKFELRPKPEGNK